MQNLLNSEKYFTSLLVIHQEIYSEELKRKIKVAKEFNALNCRFNGGTVPYGYSINEERSYVVNPLTAPIVLEVYICYANGQSACEIQQKLLKRNIVFSTARIYNLLRNRNYIGEYHYNGVVIPGGIPAIIPNNLFQKVQKSRSHKATGD